MFVMPSHGDLENRQARELFTTAARTIPVGADGSTDQPDGLLPIGTRTPIVGQMGTIVGYNDRKGGFYPADRYPYVVRRDDGYKDVYGPMSFF